MASSWLIEQHENEVWAWSLEECLFLRLGRSGMGRVFDLKAEKLLGEFRWKNPLFSGDFERMQPQMWVELLEAQLATPASDLFLARNFHLTSPYERAWQLLVFERGSRESFCQCMRFMLSQHQGLSEFLEDEKQTALSDGVNVRFDVEEKGSIRWYCNVSCLKHNGPYFPELQQKMNLILEFFQPKRDNELLTHLSLSSNFWPAFWEIKGTIRFNVAFDPKEFSSHDHLEHFLQLRQLFESYLSPTESALLLRQLSSSR